MSLSAAAGMILFDKPRDWTSHDAVEAFRRMLPKGTKVGHSGTLDPLATGLLVILVGPCTRLQERLQGLDKVYSGMIRLGLSTETGDVLGKQAVRAPVPAFRLEELQGCLDAHRGILEMDAPAYSAVKHQGKPLYHYARKGITVPAKPRKSTIYAWEALSYEAPDLAHRLNCSSGTYVRSLAESVGGKLGCGACVSSLRREKVGTLDVKDALSLEALKALSLAELARLLRASLPALEAAVVPTARR